MYIYFKALKQVNFTLGIPIIWLVGSRSIIPAGVGNILDRTVLGSWFTARIIQIGLLQQTGNDISKAQEVLRRRRN